MLKRRKILITLFTAILSCAAVALMFGFMPAEKAEASEAEPCSDIVTYADDHAHEYTILLRTFAPTCTEDGYDVYQCAWCDATMNYYHTFDADYADYKSTGHSYDTVTIAPTCTATGYTYHICVTCHDIYRDNAANPLGHDYQEVVHEAECEKDGYIEQVCTKCQTSFVTEIIDAPGHDWDGEATSYTASTCTEDGEAVYECSKCGELKSVAVSSTGHTYVPEDVAVTCLTDGYTRYTCEKCGDWYDDDWVAATGHVFENPVVTLPGDEDYDVTLVGGNWGYGYTKFTCSKCADIYVVWEFPDNYVDGFCRHENLKLDIIDATCLQVGCYMYTCPDCGEVMVVNESPMLEHDWQLLEIYQSCTVGGKKYYYCDLCGTEYVVESSEALGHDYSALGVVDPTCEDIGYTIYVCSRCGYSYEGDLTAATDHIYELTSCSVRDSKMTVTVVYECYSCGDSGVLRLTLTLVDSSGAEYEFAFGGDGTADFSGIPSGKYTAYIVDTVTGEIVSMFTYNDGTSSSESADTGSGSGDGGSSGGTTGDTSGGASGSGSGDSGGGSSGTDTGSGGGTSTEDEEDDPGEEHTHVYSIGVSNSPSKKTVTLSYKCSCGDDRTDELYVVFTSGSFSVTCYVDSTGVLSYDFLDAGTYTGTVYNGSGSRIGQFTATVAASETSSDTGAHTHVYDLVITPDVENYVIVVSYKCSCGDDLTGELEVAIVDADGDTVCIYWPYDDGIVDFKGDLDEDGTYSVVVSNMDDEVLGFIEMTVELGYGTTGEDEAYNPSTGTGTSSSDEEKSGNGTIIALLVVFLVVVAGGITAWVIYKRRKKKKEAEAAEETDATESLDDGDVTPSERTNSNSGNRYFDDDDDDD